MDEGAGDEDAVVAVSERRHLAAPETAPHLSRALSRRAPRPHLLRRQGGGGDGRNAADGESADGLGPPAARRKPQDWLGNKPTTSQSVRRRPRTGRAAAGCPRTSSALILRRRRSRFGWDGSRAPNFLLRILLRSAGRRASADAALRGSRTAEVRRHE